jgi:hypothetical protein
VYVNFDLMAMEISFGDIFIFMEILIMDFMKSDSI